MALFGKKDKPASQGNAGNAPLVEILPDLKISKPSEYNQLKNLFINAITADPFDPPLDDFFALAKRLGYRCDQTDTMQISKIILADISAGI
ncbi:MAG: hypothetical protein FWF91_04550 [Coriobacteriia bacterium]|nr:hypothetical protein [Coriobacteriia bacterium]